MAPIEDSGGCESRPVIAAIVLAAGSSRRFGPDNKLLANAGGRPLLLRVIEALLAGGLAPVIVVTGHERERIEAAIERHGRAALISLAHNPSHLAGMGGSIAAGARALPPGCDGVLITPGDMPGLSTLLVAKLLDAFAGARRSRIVFPALADGSQRNPVLWPARFIAKLATLEGERGAKGLIELHGGDTLPVELGAEDAVIDIDRPEDLARWNDAPDRRGG